MQRVEAAADSGQQDNNAMTTRPPDLPAANKDSLNDEELHRYARQLILPNFDDRHQLALKNAHVLVIGAGGLGAPVLQYLGAAGIGTISIIDDDNIDLTNLNRQVIHTTEQLGEPKAESAKAALSALNPNITISAIKSRFDLETAENILNPKTSCNGEQRRISLIIDASDNPATRHNANTSAHRYGLPLIFGGAVRMEGQVASFRSGIDANAPCYDCLFPADAEKNLAPGCSDAGILGSITAIIGGMMALEAVKQILYSADSAYSILGERLDGKVMLYDGYSLMTTIITVPKQDNCPTCGG
jgi:molybdopterin/thiamine biosynthesis adenylyltransferase